MQPISYKQETGSTDRLPCPGAPRAVLRVRTTGESTLQVEPFFSFSMSCHRGESPCPRLPKQIMHGQWFGNSHAQAHENAHYTETWAAFTALELDAFGAHSAFLRLYMTAWPAGKNTSLETKACFVLFWNLTPLSLNHKRESRSKVQGKLKLSEEQNAQHKGHEMNYGSKASEAVEWFCFGFISVKFCHIWSHVCVMSVSVALGESNLDTNPTWSLVWWCSWNTLTPEP